MQTMRYAKLLALLLMMPGMAAPHAAAKHFLRGTVLASRERAISHGMGATIRAVRSVPARTS